MLIGGRGFKMASNEQQQQSFSMKMVSYGIKKKFPGVKHIPCEQCQKIITEDNSVVLILVRPMKRRVYIL